MIIKYITYNITSNSINSMNKNSTEKKQYKAAWLVVSKIVNYPRML